MTADGDIRVIPGQGIIQNLVHVRIYPVIAINETDKFSFSHLNCNIPGISLPGILLMNHSDTGIFQRILITNSPRPVCGAIINKDEFPIMEGLGYYRVYTLREISLHIIDRNYYAYQRLFMHRISI